MRRRARTSQAPLRGEITVPGDKLISQMALLVSALAHGRSRMRAINVRGDVRATARVLQGLGVKCDINDVEASAELEGRGCDGLTEPPHVLDVGSSPTTVRLCLGLCATVPGISVLTGDAALRKRSMLRVVTALRQMGAVIDGRRHGDLAPLYVRGGELSAIDLEMTVASMEVKASVLLAGVRARGTTSVGEPSQTADHMERMLASSGLDVGRSGLTVSVTGGREPLPVDRRIPGDLSAALLFLVAAALIPGSDLTITDVGINPTRSGALDALRAMGARLDVQPNGYEGGEPVGDVRMTTSPLSGTVIDGRKVPALIDDLAVVAVAATQAEGETLIEGANSSRVEAWERVEALLGALTTMGADIKARPEGLVVRGPTPLKGGEVESRGHPEIALALAVAGLACDEDVRVKGWKCVDDSFPEFLDLLAEANGRLK